MGLRNLLAGEPVGGVLCLGADTDCVEPPTAHRQHYHGAVDPCAVAQLVQRAALHTGHPAVTGMLHGPGVAADNAKGVPPLARGRRGRRRSSDSPLAALFALLMMLGWLHDPTLPGLFLWLGGSSVAALAIVFLLARRRLAILRRAGIAQIDEMSGLQFEHKVAQLLTDLGYRTRVTRASGDYGADVVATNAHERVVVQVKCYGPGHSVGIDAVQQAAGAVAYYHADRALVVTNRTFTQPARRLAETNHVELWDREHLVRTLARLAERGRHAGADGPVRTPPPNAQATAQTKASAKSIARSEAPTPDAREQRAAGA